MDNTYELELPAWREGEPYKGLGFCFIERDIFGDPPGLLY